MVYLLALHASALQTNAMKFKQDFIGPLFIDTALDKTHYRLKDATGQDNDDPNTLSTCTFLDCDEYRTDYDGQIDTTRCKRALGIQYKHESKEDIAGFISKPVARPEYGMIYQHKGMLLQNLHRRYLYILIKLPHLLDLEQRIPSFLNCDNYGSLANSTNFFFFWTKISTKICMKRYHLSYLFTVTVTGNA